MLDEEPGFFAGLHVAIFGLGLMGGSLAMALQGKCAGLIGIDPDPAALALAEELQLVDELLSAPDERLDRADLIILAAPVLTIIRLLDDLQHLHPGSPLVLDLGSTKQAIVAVMDKLPDRFDPIGGHPMCGKEQGSLRNAEASLYHGATFALTPLERTSPKAKAAAEQLVTAVGARALWLDPVTHDRWVSATSHITYLIANTLAGTTPLAAAPLIGPGFRSATRVAISPPEIMLDILASNRQNVLAGIRDFQERLAEVEACLAANDWEGLRNLLTEAANHYEELIGT